jgi:hypothetical protein
LFKAHLRRSEFFFYFKTYHPTPSLMRMLFSFPFTRFGVSLSSRVAMLVFISGYLTACGGKKEEAASDPITADSVAIEKKAPLNEDYSSFEPLINYAAAQNPVLAAEIRSLAKKVLNPQLLTNEQDFEVFFAERDTLSNRLSKAMSELDDVDAVLIMQQDNLKTTPIITALSALGMQPTGAEGMFGGLVAAPVLTDRLKAVTSAEYVLFQEIRAQEGKSVGGEYPYLGLEAEAELIVLAEQFLNQYPNSTRLKSVRTMLYNALVPFINFSRGRGDGEDSYFVGGDCFEAYPCMTEISFHQDFVKNNPKSIFTPIIKNALKNPSTVDLQANPFRLHALVIRTETEMETARERHLDALLEGKDWLHQFQYVSASGKTLQAIVYRVFTDKAKAEAALKSLNVSDAKIVVLERNPDTYEWVQK